MKSNGVHGRESQITKVTAELVAPKKDFIHHLMSSSFAVTVEAGLASPWLRGSSRGRVWPLCSTTAHGMKGRAEVNARQSNKWTGQAAHLSLTVTIAPWRPSTCPLSFASKNMWLEPPGKERKLSWTLLDFGLCGVTSQWSNSNFKNSHVVPNWN